ncbi:hypothetical protein ACFSE1_07290 [Rhizobium helianthi]|uniref:GNAT family N-acetyltransferase n=1 Tax=Rhizobium helianthi TaxID=1132695 RepID=A0ABW4M408_9HYPH
MVGAGGGTAVVRDLQADDLPAIAALFASTFRKRRADRVVTPDLLSCLRSIYLENPWFDPDVASKVFVDEEDRVRGFIGVTAQRMVYGERKLRAALAGSLVVQDPARHPLAGARLVRSFLNGPQDLSITETANATAMGMWRKLGVPVNTSYSLTWLRPLRPAASVAALMMLRHSSAHLLAPMAHAADAVFARISKEALRPSLEPSPRRLSFSDVDRATFDAAALTLAQRFALRPDWDAASLDWFSAHAARKRMVGEPCYRLAVDAQGKPLAAYLWFRREGNIAWLLQSFAGEKQADDLVDDMLVSAYEYGCAAIRGGTQPWLLNALLRRKALLLGRSYFLADARDKSLLAPIQSGEALVSGLAGETWMRLIGDRF